MRIGYLIVVIIISFITGCSTTYTVNDFYSDGLYYDDFNKGAVGNTIKITLINDSTYKWQYGAWILHDSLVLNNSENRFNKIPISQIKKLSYKKTLPGLGAGILAGIPAGLVGGITTGIFTTDFNTQRGANQSSKSIYYGLIIGPIAGGILGVLLGWNYIYLFSQ